MHLKKQKKTKWKKLKWESGRAFFMAYSHSIDVIYRCFINGLIVSACLAFSSIILIYLARSVPIILGTEDGDLSEAVAPLAALTPFLVASLVAWKYMGPNSLRDAIVSFLAYASSVIVASLVILKYFQ